VKIFWLRSGYIHKGLRVAIHQRETMRSGSVPLNDGHGEKVWNTSGKAELNSLSHGPWAQMAQVFSKTVSEFAPEYISADELLISAPSVHGLDFGLGVGRIARMNIDQF